MIAPALPGNGETDIRLVAAATASLVIWRLQSLWLGVAVGMGAFWLLRALF